MNLSALVILITLGSAATLQGVIDEDFYDQLDIIYTSQHDIVNIFMPTRSGENSSNVLLFFVEADQSNGKNTYKGLYVINRSIYFEKRTKLVLQNGKDVTCDAEKIYIGAKDGIYTFNEQEMKAERYGSVTENIKNIAKVNGRDLFYILTENNKLYRVTEYGNKMTLDDTIVDAQQIVLDLQNNLYYYSSNNEVWVVRGGVKTKFESLPKEIFYLRLLKPPTYFNEGIPADFNNTTANYKEGIPLCINKKVFKILPNGSVPIISSPTILVQPSAYSLEAGYFQFFGHNKRIYMLEIVELIVKAITNNSHH